MTPSDASSNWLRWYDQRPLRERIVLVCGVVAMVVIGTYLLVIQPAQRDVHRTRQQIDQLRTELTQLETRAADIQAQAAQDPDQQNRERVAVLEQESARLQQQLEESIVTLVPPREMPPLLKKILAQRRDLNFIRLENLAPELVDLQAGNGQQKMQPPRLYRHRLQLEFSGTYLGLLQYLEALRALPRVMVWDEVAIETQTYPQAIVRLQLHTLSLSEGWIGG